MSEHEVNSETRPAADAPLILDLLRVRAERFPDRTPLSVPDGRSLQYGEWEERSNALGRALAGRGVRRGVRIGLLFGGMSWADYAISYFGALKAGATVTHLSPLLDPAELRRRLEQAATAGVVTDDAAQAGLAGFEGWVATTDELAAGDGSPLENDVTAQDIAEILYTSGTTGQPKALLNPHGNIAFGQSLAGAANFDAGAPILAPITLGTQASAGIVGIFAMTTRASIVLCPAGDTAKIGRLIEEFKPASVMLTPLDAIRLNAAGIGARYDLGSVETIGVASAALPPAVARGLLEAMPKATLRVPYGGGSEAVPAAVAGIYDMDTPTKLGLPRPGTEVRVLAEDGEAAAPGQVGEIWFRTKAPQRVYLDPELGADLRADGWTRTGDLGSLNDAGELVFFDRGADVIRSDGRLISSVQIENVLYDHPAVLEASVFGVDDARAGVTRPHQRIIAMVVPRDGARADSAELLEFLARRLEEHRVPAALDVVESLPRGLSGKVLKRELRAAALG